MTLDEPTSLDKKAATSFAANSMVSNGVNIDGISIGDDACWLSLPYKKYITLESLALICNIVKEWNLQHLYLRSGGVWFRILYQNIDAFISKRLTLADFVETWEWVSELSGA